ncbi:hypothetical protein WCN79_17645 [Xanthomonas axonopodis pv. vasculorum]|uniref:Uncharacterized protein n=1 Tax=Xanthomonas axonopodis pv. vasculorum TaxID=325777 RepID=A0A098Q4Q8_9XANT|nr:hypothetical protein [Xanthomonas axonopodis]KGE52942.1 hypothetical protein GW15_0205485 [Xanthomonas axonopodis pv. vasculorum]
MRGAHLVSSARALLLRNAAAFMPVHHLALDVRPRRRQTMTQVHAVPASKNRSAMPLLFLRRVALFGLRHPDGARHGRGNADRKAIAAGSERSDVPLIGHRQG